MPGTALAAAASRLTLKRPQPRVRACARRGQGRRRQFCSAGEPGQVALEMYEALTSLQQERAQDPYNWVHPVCEG
jgi:hypothetical protein